MDRIQMSQLRLLTFAFLQIAGIAVGSTAQAACEDPNTCFGTGALQMHVSGHNNSAFGFRAMGADVNGINNTAVGAKALSNTDLSLDPEPFDFGPGRMNTAIGSHALNSNTGGRANTAIGVAALLRNTEGEQNFAGGFSALENNSTGHGNVGLGAGALRGNNTGSDNTAVGASALAVTTAGMGNVAVGTFALGQGYDGGNGPNLHEGNLNVAVGWLAMARAASGDQNTAVGVRALIGQVENANTGEFNTAVGAGAMERIVSGSFNTANGHSALFSVQNGQRNTAIGTNALFSNTDGNYNTASGNSALRNMRTGVRNVAVGHRAGEALTTGSDNIIIGGDNHGTVTDAGVIRIGRSANQKKTFIAGIRGVTMGSTAAVAVFIDPKGQLGTVKSSRDVKENISPMGDVSNRLLALRPVTFRYKEADDDGSKPIQYGLIAEEVAESFPELVVYDANGKPETVSYHLLATLLLNEFQKEREVTQVQAARIAELEQEFARLAEVVERLNHASMVATTR